MLDFKLMPRLKGIGSAKNWGERAPVWPVLTPSSVR
jgi:hypothetical protein